MKIYEQINGIHYQNNDGCDGDQDDGDYEKDDKKGYTI